MFVSADNMVSRHVLVIGMTGSGKSVWVRRAVRELMEKQYLQLQLIEELLQLNNPSEFVELLRLGTFLLQ